MTASTLISAAARCHHHQCGVAAMTGAVTSAAAIPSVSALMLAAAAAAVAIADTKITVAVAVQCVWNQHRTSIMLDPLETQTE